MDIIIKKKDELYHYGVPGMKWGKIKAVMDSGMDQNMAAAVRNRADRRKFAAEGASKRYEIHKRMRGGAAAKNRGSVTDLKRDVAWSNYLASTRTRTLNNIENANRRKSHKNKKAEHDGTAIRSRGNTYIRRVLS